MTPTAEVLQVLAVVLLELRQLHKEDPAGYCRECTNPWPCKTYKIADLRTIA